MISKRTKKRLKKDQLLYDEGFRDGQNSARNRWGNFQINAEVSEINRDEKKPTPWISVKERLPEEWKPVLGMVAIAEIPTRPIIDAMVYIGNIAGEDKWRVCWGHDMLESAVTHWMPLPEPPEVE